MSFICKDLILTDKEDRMSDKNVAQEPLPQNSQTSQRSQSSHHLGYKKTSKKVPAPLTAPVSSEVELDVLDLAKKVSSTYSLLLTTRPVQHRHVCLTIPPVTHRNFSWCYSSCSCTGGPKIQTTCDAHQPHRFEDNTLSWWKVHGHHFPTLSRLVRRFLTISTTSCSVERLFSVAGQVDDGRRSSLTSDTMTLLVFIHEVLPLVRKIRVDRIVDTLGNFNSGFN